VVGPPTPFWVRGGAVGGTPPLVLELFLVPIKPCAGAFSAHWPGRVPDLEDGVIHPLGISLGMGFPVNTAGGGNGGVKEGPGSG